MNSRLLMVTSSAVLAIGGIAAIFAPAELLSSIGLADIAPPVLVQLLGALYFAFAITNWTAKDNAIGGIYSRPLALGNFSHFAIVHSGASESCYCFAQGTVSSRTCCLCRFRAPLRSAPVRPRTS